MARTLQPEDQIAHYRVVGPLGAGGMGEVYAARDEKLDRSVALKVLPPQLVRNEERVRRFITEAKSASSLSHPNIVTIYEIGHDHVRASQAGDEPDDASEAVHFISMELISGETLTQKIHHEKTDLRTLVGYLAQAAEGISKAHAAGIVHRDLKPGNIMITKDGFAKVLDFGLAKLTEKQDPSAENMTSAPTDVARTGEGVVMGTVGYMSPEQVQGKGVDYRSDVFSMGCILYEAVTRRRPFVADTDVEVMHHILREKPTPVEELNPEAPAEIRRILRRCLAKSPDQRFQSMKDLAIELREAFEEWETLSASATSATSAASVPSGALGVAPGRGVAFWAIVVAAAIVGLGGLGFGIYSFVSGRGEQAPGEAALQNMKLTVLMSRNDLGEAVLSRDGRYLAYTTRSGPMTDLTVRQVRTGSDVPIVTGSKIPIEGISFSNDGDYLYYRNRDPDLPNYSALFQVPSLGGTPRKVFFDVDTAVSFSPDGKRACWRRGLVDRGEDSLVIGDLDTGKDQELIRIKAPENFQAAPAWSPDGKTVAIPVLSTAAGVKAWLTVVDVGTGKRAKLGSKTWVGANSVRWSPDGASLLVSAFEPGIPEQIYRVAYPGGDTVRLTNDLDGYGNVSITADGKTISAIRDITVRNMWVSHGGETAPITFASGSAGSVGNVTPLPGGAVAFTEPSGNKTFLWRMGADGSGKRQLTSQGVFVMSAGYAPGAGIVFTQIDVKDEILAHLWRMDPDGGGLRQITDGKGEQMLQLSPAGNVVLFTKWGDPRAIWAVDLAGGEPYRLSDNASFALVSPDGRRVLVVKLEERDGHFFPRWYIYPMKGGDPEASFFMPAGEAGRHWSPDGKSIDFIDRQKGWNLFRKALPDGGIEPITHFDKGQIADFDWSPDGSKIVLHRRIERKESLWELRPGKGEPRLVTEFKTGQISQHKYAPDGDDLYFTYGDSTQDVVLITNFE
ncbi:MAG TPA: protein kinase [Candidatus Saccharimonadales bacterium]|nr:protein kinase [Candidatus Saccharimonadales bacterium]